ncbi:hypothetical protein WICPIJ_003059 [Wickerhamomyces pijperi]|uniref:Cytosolic endo-beta-N-acetylglucosaminidase TIM barrel domain-containing protein n=1 Tax=Wickerhamomyces pijperi TaxID=599730 RepID=A0A9P8TP24_WICPI|nr:hypothetical protein WICPIJ_003059 [Wickerhamomyces pijperi]
MANNDTTDLKTNQQHITTTTNSSVQPGAKVNSKDFLSLRFSSLNDLDNWMAQYKDTPSPIDCLRIPREERSRFKKIKPLSSSSVHHQQLLVCHDFKGNYCKGEDDSPQGYFPHHSGEHYFLQYPSLIDHFVYFSHNRISIPPVSWTEMLHRQGIASLGCIILEGGAGDDDSEMDRLVTRDTKDGGFKYVKYLSLLAQRYRFDGWLINPEAHFKDKRLANELVLFTEALRSELHQHIDQSKVIYYDSFVASKNKVSYQNGVNELNYEHFDSSDYFFTNYWWDERQLESTTAKVGFEGVKRKLFTGIDIWGRGSKVGSGGFETGLALGLIKHYGSNIALFAPGWTYENSTENEEFIFNDQKFWIGEVSDEQPGGGISTNVEHSTTPMFTSCDESVFKFYTNFSQGEGFCFAIKGKSTVFDNKWVNIGLQSYTPSTLKEGILEVEKYDPYNGGVSLKVIHRPETGLFYEGESPIGLFTFNNEVLTSSIKMRITYKYISKDLSLGNHFRLELKYYIEKRYRTNQRVSESVLTHKLVNDEAANSSEWITSEIELLIPSLKPREHFMLSGVQLRYIDQKKQESNNILDSSWILIPKQLIPAKNEQKIILLMGELSICTATSNTHPIISVKKQELSNGKILVSWRDDYDNVLHWFVYSNGKLKTVANTPHCVMDKLDRIRIDIFTRDGKVLKGHDLFV